MKYACSLRNLGFHFRPSDHELVLGYLIRKLCKSRLPSSHGADCDLYGDEEPWQIWSKFRGDVDEDDQEEETDLYFFTPLKKMTKTGKRIGRTVGTNGAMWRSEDKKNPGQSRDGKIRWEKRSYSYCSKSRTEKQRKRKRGEFTDDYVETTGAGGSGVVWIMHEYRLVDKEIAVLGLDRTAVNSCVLCRLRRKNKNDKTKRKGDWILEEEVQEIETDKSVDADVGMSGGTKKMDAAAYVVVDDRSSRNE